VRVHRACCGRWLIREVHYNNMFDTITQVGIQCLYIIICDMHNRFYLLSRLRTHLNLKESQLHSFVGLSIFLLIKTNFREHRSSGVNHMYYVSYLEMD